MPRPDPPADQHDPSRREFFRTFSRQTARNAGTVLGAAVELRRTSIEAARGILGTAPDDVAPVDTRSADAMAQPTVAPREAYRSAYRFTGESLVLLDQRQLPHRVETLELRDASEVASAMRAGVINAGPVLGDVAAYSLAMAASAAALRPDTGRQQQFRAAAGTLRGARPDVQALTAAVDLMEASYDALLDAGAASDEIAAGLREAADGIAEAATTRYAALGRAAADLLLGRPGDGRVRLLIHGDLGPLSCGMVGIGTTMFQALIAGGAGVHAWQTEAGPTGEGSRLAAYQLDQHDIPHSVIPDSAVGWLVGTRRPLAALLRADRLLANGDALTLIGGSNVAQLASAAGVPVVLIAPAPASDTVLSGREPSVWQQSDGGDERFVPAWEVVSHTLIDHTLIHGTVA